MSIYDCAAVIGSGKLAVEICKYFKEINLPVVLYEKKITDSSFVSKLCRINGIEYYSLNKAELTEKLMQQRGKKELVVSAINTYIFPKQVVNNSSLTIINYHNALLPKHPGMNAEAWAIFDQDEETGVTWHYVSEQIDSGGIIAQETIKLNPNITSLKLLQKQSNMAYKLFLTIADNLLKGEVKCKKQETSEREKLHLIKDVPNNGILSLDWDIDKIYAFLRAMDYGKIATLGIPKILFDDTYYIWDRYVLTENCQSAIDKQIYNTVSYVIDKQSDKVIILKGMGVA
jgi:methionyl-tRNA formyltransferase